MSPEGAEPLGCPVGRLYQLSPPCSKGERQSPEKPLLSVPERKRGMAGEDLTLLPCPRIVYYYYYYYYFGVSFVN